MDDWYSRLLHLAASIQEGERKQINGVDMVMARGLLRNPSVASVSQKQTESVFGYKWKKRETFEGGLPARMREWLIEKYGDVPNTKYFKDYGDQVVVLDAGCGAALSALALFEPALKRMRYVGVDISEAVDVAKQRFEEIGSQALFVQSDLQNIPLPKNSVDVIFSEGVLHHTDDTKRAFMSLLPHLKSGGRMVFYVYRKKGPIREFTDDYIREKLQTMSPDDAWSAIEPLTELGIALGEMNIEIDVPKDIDVLDIPAGKINLQRLFYWHVFKIMYRTDLTFDEMQHINFDWYAPKNAHRHSIEEVRGWCEEAGLVIEREHVEMAGISIIARKV
ncbi:MULTISPECIES: class I SAM-dependent methyltransferase [unclassified Thalassospira]|uniref:class I SAM-dependent methyltransferase n=1 Tax=unclassified Thalassospira TaxID=2648997 RepID=UPI001B17DF32|nr:class I SAM-dependent methyltransferase [Thalassospira sp.]MBO6769762.1 class I SAM-dependent methyltransferase [Thalassospira sp.]